MKIIQIFVFLRRLLLILRINKALGIRLYLWQIDYIFFDKEIPSDVLNKRVTGETTARILKILLSKGNPLFVPKSVTYLPELNSFTFHVGRDVKWYRHRDYSELKEYLGTDIRYYRFFCMELKDFYKKLTASGIKTRVIFFER